LHANIAVPTYVPINVWCSIDGLYKNNIVCSSWTGHQGHLENYVINQSIKQVTNKAASRSTRATAAEEKIKIDDVIEPERGDEEEETRNDVTSCFALVLSEHLHPVGRFEEIGNLVVSPSNDLVDSLLPRLLQVLASLDGLEELSQGQLDYQSEVVWHLQTAHCASFLSESHCKNVYIHEQHANELWVNIVIFILRRRGRG
jgi:hypothetical protein